MRIGILGSGLMGGKLGTLLARAGHDVVFSYSRAPNKLARLLGRRLASDGRHETSIAGLTLWRFSHSTEPMHALQEPGVYVVAQGRKLATVGDETYLTSPAKR